MEALYGDTRKELEEQLEFLESVEGNFKAVAKKYRDTNPMAIRGLCLCAFTTMGSDEVKIWFRNLLRTTNGLTNTEYHWPVIDYQSRLDWLEERINECNILIKQYD